MRIPSMWIMCLAFLSSRLMQNQGVKGRMRGVFVYSNEDKADELKTTTAAAGALVHMSDIESPSLSAADTATVYIQTGSPSTMAQRYSGVCTKEGKRCSDMSKYYSKMCADWLLWLKRLQCIGKDSLTLFYTGLPSWDWFEHVHLILILHVLKSCQLFKLQPKRWNVACFCLIILLEDIAYRIGIAKSTVTTVCHLWFEVMATRLKFLIKWAPKEIVQKSMPQIFEETYPLAWCTIDSPEIERPVGYQARAKTYSNYKNTILQSF